MDQFALGALAAGSTIVGLFFLRYWRDSGDRLFLIFAVSFWLIALARLLFALRGEASETTGFTYLIRLVAFVLIIAAIVDKNRR